MNNLTFLKPNITPVCDEFIPQEDLVATAVRAADNYKPSILGVKVNGLREAFEFAKAQKVPNGTFASK